MDPTNMVVTECKEQDWDTDLLLFSQHTASKYQCANLTSVSKVLRNFLPDWAQEVLDNLLVWNFHGIYGEHLKMLPSSYTSNFGATWAFDLMLHTCTAITIPFIFAHECDQLWDCSFQYSSTHKCHISLLPITDILHFSLPGDFCFSQCTLTCDR